MENQEKLKTGVGTKEPERLTAELVKIQEIKIEERKLTDGVSDMVVFVCKHPKKDENISISSVKYIKGEKVKSSGTWFKLDEDKKIFKLSALAVLLNHYKVANVNELVGKELETGLDEKGYLCIKAY